MFSGKGDIHAWQPLWIFPPRSRCRQTHWCPPRARSVSWAPRCRRLHSLWGGENIYMNVNVKGLTCRNLTYFIISQMSKLSFHPLAGVQDQTACVMLIEQGGVQSGRFYPSNYCSHISCDHNAIIQTIRLHILLISWQCNYSLSSFLLEQNKSNSLKFYVFVKYYAHF